MHEDKSLFYSYVNSFLDVSEMTAGIFDNSFLHVFEISF